MDVQVPDQRARWEEQGYLVVRGILDGECIRALSEALDRILDRAAAGAYADRFRWIDEERRIPDFISDLLSPGKYDPAFGVMLDEAMIPFIEGLVGEPVRCSWMMLLAGGGGKPYRVPLHRDNSAVNAPDEEEWIERLRGRQCYFQAPLWPDNFLHIVPGSHLRVANEVEIAAAESDGHSVEVPGEITIELEPGDVVFRHTNALHAGVNPEGHARRTFVSGVWAASLPLLDIERQDYALLDHPGFVEGLPGHCRAAVERYLEAYRSAQPAPGPGA